MLESPGRLNAEFKRFEAAQGRNYGPGEIRFRLRVFRDNLQKIVECNERQGSYTCAENMVSVDTYSYFRLFILTLAWVW